MTLLHTAVRNEPRNNEIMSDKPEGPTRILAVDDDKAILDGYLEILCPPRELLDSLLGSSAGDGEKDHHLIPSFEVTMCGQGQEAVEAVRWSIKQRKPYAVAFLDVHIPPGPDGVWTAEHIRQLDPNISIVMATGHAEFNLVETARRVPPLDKLMYIMKPFTPQEIWQFAAALSAKWKTERQLRLIQADLENMVNRRTAELTKTNEQLRKEIESRVRAELARRSSEETFRNMITSNSDGIVILSSRGIVYFVNPAAEELFGSSSRTMVGQAFGFPVVDGRTTELEIVRDDGKLLTAEMRVVKTIWEGESAYLASVRDVTYRKQMEHDLQKSLANLHETIRGTVRAMALVVETRDPYTAGHQRRVADLSRRIAEEMGFPRDEVDGLYLAALIHDIGKISVPAEILSKPGRLSDSEFSLIKSHPQVAYDILKGIEFPWPIVDVIVQHHERIDGSGYPQGLTGEKTLPEARILAVADVVEAMASHRPYRPALGIERALEEIAENKGKRYDILVADTCLSLFRDKGYQLEV